MKQNEFKEENENRWARAKWKRQCFPLAVVYGLLTALLFSFGCSGLKLPSITMPTVAVSGRILEAGLLEDKPIANAWVTISGSVPAYTDREGKFTVHVPIADTSGQTIQIAISVAKHGYVARLIEDRFISTDSSVEEIGEIYLVAAPNTSSLKGKVIDKTTGRGVPNAEVILSGDLILRVRTAMDGSFLISGIIPSSGTFSVQARHPDFLTVFDLQTGRNFQFVNIRDGDETVNSVTLELYPLGTPSLISGQVINAETLEPIGGAKVTLGGKQTVSDAEGKFNIPDAPTGQQTLKAEHPAFLTFSETLLINGDPLTIFLFPPGSLPSLPFTISGKVTLQGETNHSGVRIEVRQKVSGAIVDVTTTDTEGKYALWIPPGTYLVRASKDGFAEVEREVTVPKGVAVADVNFTLVRLEGAP